MPLYALQKVPKYLPNPHLDKLSTPISLTHFPEPLAGQWQYRSICVQPEQGTINRWAPRFQPLFTSCDFILLSPQSRLGHVR